MKIQKRVFIFPIILMSGIIFLNVMGQITTTPEANERRAEQNEPWVYMDELREATDCEEVLSNPARYTTGPVQMCAGTERMKMQYELDRKILSDNP